MELKSQSARTVPSLSSCASLRSWRLGLLALGSAVLLAGCAGNPPSEQMAVTESAVNAAVSSGGPEYAPVETKNAQDKLAQARIALNDKEYDQARNLAQQAEWDARVAERKSQAVKAQNAVKDAQQGVMELRQEGLQQAQ
ncbi:DUF4398 domain-containing protein [Pseudomonas sp. BGr12]|uniref:DUF4398 domain-containing protein n=1 Tax=unclassified Pseudomonas TaxID=196821 RepID=UPI00177E9D09|nr:MULTISPECIES: DUF4398 domain-containing protein [unclassified Pseudomonas]MBD9503615.1 DUF4398 domain-containing protein [Pseudomonas sp. PDM17]MBD9574098.1 DUF4398 domain-containing protein [Pseudomonas sp. PDM23]MBD9671936.1 DUF4398 domain-containing protein [Pseudomonas sp. PDM21]MDL2425558.1 DUF4398 domain-containing protein [Pseudomonas sp. BJa5]